MTNTFYFRLKLVVANCLLVLEVLKMMINKRLISTVKESKKYIAGNLICQWCSLIANISMMAVITQLLGKIYMGTAQSGDIIFTGIGALLAIGIRFVCTYLSSKMGYLSSKAVKKTLSIPAWLNNIAMEQNINFSKVLQKALMNELGLHR